MSDNPFADPDDPDATVVIARPAAALPMPVSEAEPVLGSDRRFADLPPVGGSPIAAAAAPLLTLLAGLRTVSTLPEPGRLRERAMLELRRFEQSLRQARVPEELIRPSHYTLCASLDDVVQNSPWGSRGPWADASLVSTFHQEVRSGERYFELLTRLCQTPGQYLPVIELMYICMSVGMQGRYRLSPRGPAELDRVREETYLVILRQRGAADPALSPHWQGVSAPYALRRPSVPMWLTGTAALCTLTLAYGLLSFGLNGDSDRTFAAALAMPPTAMPTISRAAALAPLQVIPSPAPGARKILTDALRQDVQDGLVGIVGSDAVPIVRIQGAGMFASGSATLDARYEPVLARIAAALQARPGSLMIRGYTDNQPIHTLAFPSNYQLSLARAQAASAVLANTIAAGRLRAEGRADSDPIADNATADGRQRNRRIEITAAHEDVPQ